MKKEDILANCIDEIQSGKCTLEDCLVRYPDLRDELRPLLKIVSDIQSERATPSHEFKQRAKRRLLEAMQLPTAAIENGGAGIFGWLKPLAPARSFPLIVVFTIMALIAAGSATVYASQGSLPDDTLYPVKIGAENLQIALTISPEARANLHLKLAQRRIEEVVTQSRLGRNISTSALEAVAIQIDAAVTEIGRILPEDTKTLLSQLSESTLNQQITLSQLSEAAPEAAQPALEQALDATQRGNLIAQVAYGNPDFLDSLPSVLDDTLEAAYFKIEGTLLSAEGGNWNIGGLLLNNINVSQEIPPIGSRVEVKGLVRGAQIFISEIEHEEEIKVQVKIKGVFAGTNSDGTIWYIGGIPVGKPQNIVPPPQGNQLEIEGVIQNGIFTVAVVESKENEEEIGSEGVLLQVNSSEKTIVLDIAGAQFIINISESLIKGEDGQLLTLVDLESVIGEDVEVDGLYVRDGRIFAKEVYADIEQEYAPTVEEENEGIEEDEGEGDKVEEEDEEIDEGEGEGDKVEGDDEDVEEGEGEGDKVEEDDEDVKEDEGESDKVEEDDEDVEEDEGESDTVEEDDEEIDEGEGEGDKVEGDDEDDKDDDEEGQED